MGSWLRGISKLLRRESTPSQAAREPVELDSATLGQLVKSILSAPGEELSCDECFVQLDQFVEMHLTGKQPADALSLVQAHLQQCGTCCEEFEALLAALQAVDEGRTSSSR